MKFHSPTRFAACQRARAWISRALDDDLDEATSLRLGEHVAGCTECRRHQEVLEQGRVMLRSAEAEPSENFEWKVQLGIQRALRERAAGDVVPTPNVGFWRPAVASAAVVAVTVVGLGLAFLPGNGPTNTTSPTIGDPWAANGQIEPDLSGGVPAVPIEFDAISSNFGIRTVGGSTATDVRFQGDLHEQVRDANRRVRPSVGSAIPGSDLPASGYWHPHPWGRSTTPDVQVLQLRYFGSRLPSATASGDSSVLGTTPRR